MEPIDRTILEEVEFRVPELERWIEDEVEKLQVTIVDKREAKP